MRNLLLALLHLAVVTVKLCGRRPDDEFETDVEASVS
jgi:hypothetical protein